MHIYPPSAKSPFDPDYFTVSIGVSNLVERLRFNTTSPVTNDICYAPMSSFRKSGLTPFDTTYLDRPCGEIVRTANMSDFNCEIEKFTATPPLGNGAKVETVRVNMSNPLTSAYVLLDLEIPNANFPKEIINNTAFTNGTIYSSYYRYV